MREISILKSLSDQPYFVKILDVIKDEAHKDKIIYCIFEYCSSTLGKFFMKQQKAIPLERIQSMMRQMLTAVDIMHGKMILHRDIKPDNILMDKDGKHPCDYHSNSIGNIKFADFGLAKKASFMQRRKSNTIVSLWYRAPEIILGSEDYLLGVDMWSMGCIFAEFYTLKPVF
jgi:serine/threonine protein kinase